MYNAYERGNLNTPLLIFSKMRVDKIRKADYNI